MTMNATDCKVEAGPRPAIRDLIWDLRPETWEELCGNQEVISRLMGYCASGMPPKQILLIGPPGCGKTTVARLTAMAMACSGRVDTDPTPCGACDSCREFCGSLTSNSTVYLEPETTQHEFNEIMMDVMHGRRIFAGTRRPIPLIADDLDEFAQVRQQRMKRLMDVRWQGFILACSTNANKIDKALQSRFHRFVLEPPTTDEMIDWAGRIVARTGIEVADNAALRALAMRGACNFRTVLSILQPLKDLGRKLDVRSVEDAARKTGYA